MNILARIERLYEHSGRVFMPDDVLAHLATGYTFVTPRSALMGFLTKADSVRYSLARGDAITPARHAEPYGDCWFVWLAVGRLTDFLPMIPFDVPYVAFARRDKVRIWKFKEITRLAKITGTG